MIIRATATIGAVNRPGNSAPRANPTAQTMTIPATPVTTGAMGGVPQVTCCAVRTYSASTPARNAASTQNIVPASEHSCRAQAGRAVVASRSPTLRRLSRDPAQAANPAAKMTMSGQNLFSTTVERTGQRAG